VSTLHIKEVQNADYRGSYECWMLNQYGSANTSLVIFKPGSKYCLSLSNILINIVSFHLDIGRLS